MFGLFERIEAMGPRGGWLGVGVAAALLLVAALAVWGSFVVDGRWWVAIYRLTAGVLGTVAMAVAMVGVRQLTQRHYPPPEEVFPPLAPEAFRAAVTVRAAPIFACTRCRVIIEATWDTGSCPVCASSVDYYSVTSDDDAAMVLLAMPGA